MSKIDTINDKRSEIDKELDRVRKKREAKRLGFDDDDDYELWFALELLRKSNLNLREENANPNGQKIRMGLLTGPPFAA
ncbi:hypothetical protein [Agrococcus casei]|uniref:hypothetical protein n=1 Tax=Agrococcus casei TaxID=343512 RepID=UPI003F93AE99